MRASVLFFLSTFFLIEGQIRVKVPRLLLSPLGPVSRPGNIRLHINANRKSPLPSLAVIEGKPPNQEDLLEQEWSSFKINFNKIYESPEQESFRREIFIENRGKIERFNQEFSQGLRGFVSQINPYADLLHHEFTDRLNGYNRSLVAPSVALLPGSSYVSSVNVVQPERIDWREIGAVTPVKNQGDCRACWAFAAAGALEGHHFRKTNELVDVSEQNLIDCTGPYGNSGCKGGNPELAYEYVRDNNGVDGEEIYPYEERTAECRFKREGVVVTCTGFVEIPSGDERALELALATIGPVSAAIDASKETFQFYRDGIYEDPECGNKPEELNHAVLIVGYGQEPDGQKYWLIKNSYGPQWGNGGYLKMSRDNANQCGIAIATHYPLV